MILNVTTNVNMYMIINVNVNVNVNVNMNMNESVIYYVTLTMMLNCHLSQRLVPGYMNIMIEDSYLLDTPRFSYQSEIYYALWFFQSE